MTGWLTREKQLEAYDAIESERDTCQVPGIPDALTSVKGMFELPWCYKLHSNFNPDPDVIFSLFRAMAAPAVNRVSIHHTYVDSGEV